MTSEISDHIQNGNRALAALDRLTGECRKSELTNQKHITRYKSTANSIGRTFYKNT